MNHKQLLTWIATVSALTACDSMAPSFTQPSLSLPQEYKTAAPEEILKGNWKPAAPLEQQDRGQWWKIFADPELNALEQKAIDANQTLKAAAARVEQSRAMVRTKATSLLPDVDIGANAIRARPADAGTAAFGGSGAALNPYNLFSTGATASYEVDLFARARDNEKAFGFDADAQEAIYKSTLLALQADVASHYFRLRTLDSERALLQQTVQVREEAQRIMQKRFKVGSVGAVDVSRTENDLANAQAELIALNRQRATLENALAILLGENPSDYHFTESTEAFAPPPIIPAGIPSSLLLRRPDIASAQAQMAAANRRIGVARTAFFPSLMLTASGGFESAGLSDIFKWSSRSWALGQLAGSALTMTVFDNGRIAAGVDVANAAYDEAVAHYRQQVLVAFGDVENALSDQRLLAEQSIEVDKANEAAGRTTSLLQKRYDEGDVAYFEVVDAQRNSLATGRTAIQTRGARQLATIALIRALGGDWPETREESNQVSVGE